MTGAARSIFDDPRAFLEMGRVLADGGHGERAAALAEQALAGRPGDPLIAALARRMLSRKVPAFHGPMLADDQRNAAYRRAIEALAPGRRVLDIGTGSGLLAMIAARAGAAHVVACEKDPMLARTARDIVAANGLADRVTVLARESTKLDRERDLGGGADLVISEIFSHDLLGEHALPALADARGRLCRPEARFLPAAASVRVALADFPVSDLGLDSVEGFDLSLFARHVARVRNARPGAPGLQLRSDPHDLFHFTFDDDSASPETGRARPELRSHGGRVAGLAQWLRIDLAPGVAYENAPGPDAQHHWPTVCHPGEPRETAAGEAVAIGGWHDARTLALWME